MALYTPTIAAGVALGGSPPAPSLTDPRDDYLLIGFGTGSAPTTGALVAVTFGGSLAAWVALGEGGQSLPIPNVQALNAVTQALGLEITTFTVDQIIISCTTAPAASQAASTYQIGVSLLF